MSAGSRWLHSWGVVPMTMPNIQAPSSQPDSLLSCSSFSRVCISSYLLIRYLTIVGLGLRPDMPARHVGRPDPLERVAESLAGRQLRQIVVADLALVEVADQDIGTIAFDVAEQVVEGLRLLDAHGTFRFCGRLCRPPARGRRSRACHARPPRRHSRITARCIRESPLDR